MVYLELVDLTQLFRNLSFEPVLANRLDISTVEGKEKLTRMLYNRYEGDSLNILPTCDCGLLQGGYNVGAVCDTCGTVCEYSMDKPLESLIWFKTPEGIHRLINPMAWIILSNAMTTSGFNIIEWLCNPTYKARGRIPPKLARLEAFLERSNIARGLNSFYENFDAIMIAIFGIKGLVKEKGPRQDDVRRWIEQNRNKIFTEYLPIPSKVGFVMEKNGNSTFVDKTITLAADALLTIISIENSVLHLPIGRKQSRTVKAIVKLAAYYASFINDTLGKKPGILRRHVYGGRCHFSARAVITSIAAPHDKDELHIPWSLALQLLRVHLTNKLLKLGYSPVQIQQRFMEYALRYDPLFDQLFRELIAESPYKGIPVTFGRNPTLARGSIQLFYVTLVKPDPSINTISISELCLKAPNADFDGDEMNLMLVLDMSMHRRLERLSPNLYALDLGAPGKLSGNLQLPGPVVNTISNWLYEHE